jgi:hypothetical protein
LADGNVVAGVLVGAVGTVVAGDEAAKGEDDAASTAPAGDPTPVRPTEIDAVSDSMKATSGIAFHEGRATTLDHTFGSWRLRLPGAPPTTLVRGARGQGDTRKGGCVITRWPRASAVV